MKKIDKRTIDEAKRNLADDLQRYCEAVASLSDIDAESAAKVVEQLQETIKALRKSLDGL